MYQDKTLHCKECGTDFVFTAREQEFYAEKGFQNEPSRCPECRAARKRQNAGQGYGGPRQMYAVTCSECGAPAEVPFKPTGNKPVYCPDCFRKQQRY
ncbi:zinc-binding protein [Clostridiales bacterium PH28_bin88]|nr:zinc-binding protein [Clostridiales bacterium PH28_bin88]